MKPRIVALFAVALAAASTPAAACGDFCLERAVSDDAYPPSVEGLSPTLHALVRARDDRGLSSAGFYNDPSLALAFAQYAPPAYDAGPNYYAPHRRWRHVVRSRY